MEHLTFFKILRVVLAVLSMSQLCSEGEASNMMGGMSAHAKGDTIDFSLGKIACKDDDYEDEEEEIYDGKCLDVKPSAWTLSNMYRDQPLYMNFRPRTEEAMLVDNMCFTFFPLPDDQFTYIMYTSTVYRDGSNLIESDIITDVQLGIFKAASPYCTYKEHVLGYAGCDTFVMYRCFTSSDCRNKNTLFTFGLSQSCKQISISCLQKIEDIIQGNGIPEQDYVALPMKMPTQCVFEPMCTFKGEFANEVGINMGYNFNHHISEPVEIFEIEDDYEYYETPYEEPCIEQLYQPFYSPYVPRYPLYATPYRSSYPYGPFY